MDNWFDEQEQKKPGFDYRALMKDVWRRKWLFFIPFVLCLSMAIFAIKTMTPLYYSSGQLEVRTDVYRSQLLNDPMRNLGGRRRFDEELQWEMENLLNSPAFLERIVRELGMEKKYMAESRVEEGPALDETAAVNKAIGKLARRIRIADDGHRLYRIGVIDPDPQQAYDLARVILDRFLEEYRKVRTAPRASTQEFLLEQKKTYDADLEAAEAELNSYLVEISSSGLLGNPVNASNLASVEDHLNRMQERLDGPDARELADLQRQAKAVLGALPAVDTFAKDVTISNLTRTLIDLGVEVMTRADIGSQDEVGLERGRQRVQIINRVEELVTLQHSNLSILDRNRLSQYIYFALYTDLERRVVNRVTDDVRSYRAFLVEQPRQSSRLADLQSRVSHMNDLVMTIEREITQQRMNLEAGMSDVGLQVSIRQQPFYNPIPAEPNKLRLAFLGFALSVALGGGLVVLSLLLDKTFKTIDSIESTLGFPVLGTLPQVKLPTAGPQRQLRLLLWLTIILGILAVGAFGFLVLYPRLSL